VTRPSHADPLLTLAANAAAIAWNRMAHWRPLLDSAAAGEAVDAKDEPNNLVTSADAQIEALVTGYLRRFRPTDRVIGEEGADALTLGDVDGGTQLAAQLLPLSPEQTQAAEAEQLEWHVDPIDGTVNYVRGIPSYCFSIGACRAGDRTHTSQWRLGLVAAPELDCTWFALPGQGAWKTAGLPGFAAEAPHRICGTPAGRRGRVVATGFGYAPERRALQLREFAAVMDHFDDVRRMGSAAIDLCQVAEGQLNAYYERGLGIYDWAGGALIAAEAGVFLELPAATSEPLIAADTQATLRSIAACVSATS